MACLLTSSAWILLSGWNIDVVNLREVNGDRPGSNMSISVIAVVRKTMLNTSNYASAAHTIYEPPRAVISVTILTAWMMIDLCVNTLDGILARRDRCITPSNSLLGLRWIDRDRAGSGQ